MPFKAWYKYLGLYAGSYFFPHLTRWQSSEKMAQLLNNLKTPFSLLNQLDKIKSQV